jgi:hypothetical protein
VLRAGPRKANAVCAVSGPFVWASWVTAVVLAWGAVCEGRGGGEVFKRLMVHFGIV